MFEYNSEKHYPKETESRVLIRFQDCDPLRHLNNAKYFDYFFNAREDQVPKLYGVEMMDFIKKYQAAWVIYNHNISYVKPAMVGEWVRIKSRIIWHNHNTVVLEYYMTDDSEMQLKTLLWTTMRYVTLAEGKSTDHFGVVNDFLTATSWNIDISGILVKDRVKTLSQELKKS
ncbi:acyl-CoA thioesterase [Algoriphagus persicinus]|uniref:acyl-CoA thioesterase n=1 Tax=Algoriphagus persicinus TaxID=3108754 RepID=UPI002B3C3139|nr:MULTISPECIES: acyl-CoA thioesterase [unclassified Algoriphagus]MEB2779933.1 acyl-CoA thioesterase [Algoriphagus sp. C2-6-M1]MEB2786849.1 acyl-CoA thioesterase [Algoriphagus sp. E1-3-M2]